MKIALHISYLVKTSLVPRLCFMPAELVEHQNLIDALNTYDFVDMGNVKTATIIGMCLTQE